MGLDICHVTPSVKTKDTIEYFTLEELKQKPDFIENHKHLVTFIDNGDDKKIAIIYYVDKGYQRKRMTKNFINVFENDKLYFELNMVKKAKLFLQANAGENQEELEQTFQANFIDNFVVGSSVFFASW